MERPLAPVKYGSRTADKVIAAMLRRSLLESDTPKGPVRRGPWPK